jgi:hypothetical protein
VAGGAFVKLQTSDFESLRGGVANNNSIMMSAAACIVSGVLPLGIGNWQLGMGDCELGMG